MQGSRTTLAKALEIYAYGDLVDRSKHRNLANIMTKPVINKEGTKTVSTSDLDGNHRDPLLISKQEPWYIEDATIKDGRLD
ncbi:hypothetical protein TIFTF001_036767 [Ficus carica]|uniref:Uncharacterized protein n=1 Tax=Ficus carica TaxID=3494 RepID=A0AA88E412_FICCA|nr:hypothetical protein TIFTF001_036767 [Ficus carica]